MAPNLVGDDALPPGWTAAARRHLLAGDIALARGLQPEALDHFPLGLARLLQAGLSDHPLQTRLQARLTQVDPADDKSP